MADRHSYLLGRKRNWEGVQAVKTLSSLPRSTWSRLTAEVNSVVSGKPVVTGGESAETGGKPVVALGKSVETGGTPVVAVGKSLETGGKAVVAGGKTRIRVAANTC